MIIPQIFPQIKLQTQMVTAEWGHYPVTIHESSFPMGHKSVAMFNSGKSTGSH